MKTFLAGAILAAAFTFLAVILTRPEREQLPKGFELALQEEATSSLPTLKFPPQDPALSAQVRSDAAARLPALKRTNVSIGRNLRRSFARAGAAAWLPDLDEALLHFIDIYSLLKPGSRVVLWTTREQLIAAEIPWGSRRLRIAYYQGNKAPAGWYDQRGRSLSGPLRARPLPVSRITSNFGTRLHPITGHRTQHHGVDYGAAIGTPVHSIGDGKVTVSKLDEHAGNMITISHPGSYTSTYMHLDKRSVEKGSHVTEGKVIGTVGQTGAATGPHLHFELRSGGVLIDPANTKRPHTYAMGPIALNELRKTFAATNTKN